MKLITRSLVLLLSFAALLAACGTPSSTTLPTAATGATTAPAADATAAPAADATAAPAAGGKPIKIGSKDFTEAILVAEMYAQLLEANGIAVERKLNLGATPIAQAALEKGDIDMYPEYTSTGLLEVLKKDPIADQTQIIGAVRKGYEDAYKITWLEPSPFNDTNALAMTKAKADELGIKSYSDLVAKSSTLKLGGPAEFPERKDTAGLVKAYTFDPKLIGENYVQLGTGALRYEALTKGDIDVVVAFGTDGQIGGLGLTLLKDDKSFYPVYQIAPVIRQDTLASNPKISEILNKFAPLLTDADMSSLNWQVDGPDKKEVAAVAKAFLQKNGLVK